MKRVLFVCVVSFVLVTTICDSVWAQARAQISGTVRDESGAVLPGVEIIATQTETGIARSVVTNETGSYVLPDLAVGPYRFEAALPGFRTFVQTGIVLQVNGSPVVNPILSVGQVADHVEVEANAALVETRGAAVGQVIENERILELPLNGRQVTDLIALSGAAVQTAVANTGTWLEGVLISIAGGQSFGVMYSLDGAMHNNIYEGSQMPMPFPDALQEFKVEESGSSAAGGTRGSGGSVSAVTKSGTNDLHGDAFEFVRNYIFNARNFFAAQRDSLKRNQYGGTLGGPVKQNKLFFFGGYQGTQIRTNPATTIAYVPTTATLAGDFTAFASPACNAGKPTALKGAFVNNQIDPALFSKAAVDIAGRLPKATDECGTNTYGIAQNHDDWQAVGKVDYQLSAKQSMFGRYLAAKANIPHPYTLTGNILTTNAYGFDNFAQSFALGSTYLLDNATINSFRVGFNRVAARRVEVDFFGPTDVGIKNYSAVPHMMGLTVSGGFSLASGNGAGTFRPTGYQIGDDVSLARGNHQMTFGANITHWRTTIRSDRASLGMYAFNGAATGLGMSDFLMGALTTLTQGSRAEWSSRQSYVGAYITDVWKTTSKLTLSYGLRWEPFLPLHLTEGAVYSYSDDRFLKGIKSTAVPNGPAGLYFPGDPGFPKNAAINKKWKYLAPRVGLAWDPRGDGKTSIRSAYGIAYDFSGSSSFGGSASSPPWGLNVTLQSPAGGLEDPWRDFPGGIPVPYAFNPHAARFTPSATFYTTAKYDMSEPMIQTWNLSVQRQIPANLLVSASYLGSKSTHLWVQNQINRAVYFPGAPVNGVCTSGGYVLRTTAATCSTTSNTDLRRRLSLLNPQEGQYISSLSVREDSGNQSYNGLLLSIQRRATRGVNISANYTWSHCLGLKATANASGTGGGGYLDPNDRNFDRGNCDSDRRQLFNLTTVAETPRFANPTMRVVMTGWRLSGIYKKSTGAYLTPLTGLDRVLSGFAGNQRPNQILENPYGDRNSSNYLNPKAFAQPDPGTIGNMRTANIVGLGTWQFDLALARTFGVREGQKLELRAEAFNVLNGVVRADPGTVGGSVTFTANTTDPNGLSINSNTFGQIKSAYDPRIIQFAIKYVF
jgi:hypothetical protein